MENDVLIPSKLIFYCRFVDNIYSRLKLGDNVLFDWLNNYHPNIKVTIEVNPRKFLNTKTPKFIKDEYALRFINSVVNEFYKDKECGDESFIIPPTLFEITKPFIFV